MEGDDERHVHAPHDNHASAVLRAVAQMGRDLDIATVAEGVESADQLAPVGALGCDAAQGYLIGRPQRRHPSELPAEATRAA